MKNNLIVWDLDGALYSDYTNWMGRSSCFFAEAFQNIMGDNAPSLSIEQLRVLINKSFSETSFGVADLSRKFGVNAAQLHTMAHALLDPTEVVRGGNKDLQAAFQKLQDAQHTSVILTHGSKDWAKRVIEHLGISHFFDERLILGGENVEFNSKARSIKPFDIIAGKAQSITGQNFGYSDMVVVEDSIRNLQHPHDAGMKTILVHWGDEKPPEPHIDHQVARPSQAIDLILP